MLAIMVTLVFNTTLSLRINFWNSESFSWHLFKLFRKMFGDRYMGHKYPLWWNIQQQQHPLFHAFKVQKTWPFYFFLNSIMLKDLRSHTRESVISILTVCPPIPLCPNRIQNNKRLVDRYTILFNRTTDLTHKHRFALTLQNTTSIIVSSKDIMNGKAHHTNFLSF